MTGALVIRDANVDRYIAEINRYPLLGREEEIALALRYHEHNDVEAAHQLVISNLRFVVKIAHQYKGYGLRLLDLIQEGNIGLMMAVKRFDPHRGYRLISYAVWWIRAYIRDFITRSWSLVKLGTTEAQRKLFFKLRSARARLQQRRGEADPPTSELATELGMPQGQVADMEQRLAARDYSLDARLDTDSAATHLDMLSSTGQDQETALVEAEEQRLIKGKVDKALTKLSDKERYIVEQRVLADEPKTLQELGDEFRVSRERVRQLESRALKKLRTYIESGQIQAAA